MNNHPRIQGCDTGYRFPYINPANLIHLTEQSHKLNNKSSIYMDQLLFNYELSTKVVYKECKFLYVLREPAPVLKYMIEIQKIKPIFAARYYTYRLRRICEMAKRTPNAVLLTWEDLLANRGISLLENYLNLKQPILYDPSFLMPYKIIHKVNLDQSLLADTDNSYQKYLYWLKNYTQVQYWS